LEVAGANLEQATAPNTWTLQGTEGFAEEARREVPELPPVTPGATEEEVRKLRERATPPPVPRR